MKKRFDRQAQFITMPEKVLDLPNFKAHFTSMNDMVGILLLMHEPLAEAFMATAMHLFDGEQERIEAINVKADQDLHDVHRMAMDAIERLDNGSGVLVLTDVLGGTPSNCCCQLSTEHKVQVITGVSPPMLLRAITYRTSGLEIMIEKALSGGKNGAIRIDPQ